ncbi:MAG: FAD-dependent oxidoreductase [Actinobacteria bacterium]|nr:FAD-dependent oxidoreductase [Actinomycetota bacterium]
MTGPEPDHRALSTPTQRRALHALEAAGIDLISVASASYRRRLAQLSNTQLRNRQPLGLAQPRSLTDISRILRIAQTHGVSVSVLGGGHSARSVIDGAVVLDLQPHFDSVAFSGGELLVGGGATVANVLATAAVRGRTVPVGRAGTVGMGLFLHGGIGTLTRQAGFTCDHIRGVTAVLADGSIREIGPQGAAAQDKDLWWALRGVGSLIGVMTQLRVSTVADRRVWSWREEIEAVAAIDWLATSLHTPADQCYTIVLSGTAANVECSATQPSAPVPRRLGGLLSSGASEHSCRYSAQPGLPPPGTYNAEHDVQHVGELSAGYFIRPDGLSELSRALRSTCASIPARGCFVELQQIGGRSAEGPRDMAFWPRDAAWLVSLHGPWAHLDERVPVQRWLAQARERLMPLSLSTYLVDLPPTHSEAQLRDSFGPNASRLQRLLARLGRKGPDGARLGVDRTGLGGADSGVNS